MTIDARLTAHADIATDLPEDDSTCCNLGDCEACNPDLDDDLATTARMDDNVSYDATFDLVCALCHSAECTCSVSDDPEMLYERVAVLTGDLTDNQRVELAALLTSDALSAELLAFVLRDQAGETVAGDEMPTPTPLAVCSTDQRIPGS